MEPDEGLLLPELMLHLLLLPLLLPYLQASVNSDVHAHFCSSFLLNSLSVLMLETVLGTNSKRVVFLLLIRVSSSSTVLSKVSTPCLISPSELSTR